MQWRWLRSAGGFFASALSSAPGRRRKRPCRHGMPVKSFTPFSQLVTFGGLEWRGGLELASD